MLLLLLCAATGTSRKVANRQLKRFEMWRWRRMEEIRLTDRVEDEYILYRVKEDWEDQDVDVRIILRWIFRKWEGVVGTGWSWLRIGHLAGTSECGNELSGSIKCGEFLDYLQNQLTFQEGLC